MHNQIDIDSTPNKEEEATVTEAKTMIELADELLKLIQELRFEFIDADGSVHTKYYETFAELIYAVFKDPETKRIKAMLLQMKLRLKKTIGSIKQIKQQLLSHISLLFGLCCSHPHQILSAYFGNSLARIPSL